MPGLSQEGLSSFARSVLMFYLVVVLETGDVVRDRLRPKEDPEPVVQLEAGVGHELFEARAFDPGEKPAPQFAFVVAAELAAEDRGQMIGLDGMRQGTDQFFVDRLRVLRPLEDDVRGVFGRCPTAKRRIVAIASEKVGSSLMYQ
jgi:hypothetical protein